MYLFWKEYQVGVRLTARFDQHEKERLTMKFRIEIKGLSTGVNLHDPCQVLRYLANEMDKGKIRVKTTEIGFQEPYRRVYELERVSQ